MPAPNNHPNRNWRRTMRAASDAYVACYRWPDEDGAVLLTPDQLKRWLCEAFEAGYAGGRSSTQ